MNQSNADFAIPCHEDFEIVTGGRTGTVTATNIDDLTQEVTLSAGGQNAGNVVIIYMPQADYIAAEIQDGAVFVVRGKRVRLESVGNDGDNNITLNCKSSGFRL
jgi:hypothetical protein